MREAARRNFEQMVLLQHTTSGAVDRLGKILTLVMMIAFIIMNLVTGETVSAIQGLKLSGEEWERVEVVAEKADMRLRGRLAEVLKERREERQED